VATYLVKIPILDDDGDPLTGVVPTIRIRNATSGALAITDANTTEIGDGWFTYSFTSYDPTVEYVARVYESTLTGSNRYAWIGFGGNAADLLAGVVEGAYTIQDVLAILLSQFAGSVTGATGSVGDVLQYWNQAATKARISQTVSDEFGNRTTALDVTDL